MAFPIVFGLVFTLPALMVIVSNFRHPDPSQATLADGEVEVELRPSKEAMRGAYLMAFFGLLSFGILAYAMVTNADENLAVTWFLACYLVPMLYIRAVLRAKLGARTWSERLNF